MADESNARLPSESPTRTPTVFVTDAAAESVRIADTLRTAGYVVVDVPLSMLVARAQVQRPNVVLVDVDAPSALAEIARLRKLPGGGAVDFVYFSNGEGEIRNADDALSNDGSAFFRRPIDIGALVRRVESLTGGPTARPEARPSTPPPSLPINLRSAEGGRHPEGASKRFGSAPPERASSSNSVALPAPGLRGPPLPMSTPSLADLVDPPRSFGSFGAVSNELQQLLAEAEMRVDANPPPETPLASPEEEIETVLPADVLASLDEPIEADEDEEHDPRLHSGPGIEGTGAHAKGTTSGGSRHTTASGRTHERRIGSENPPRELTPSRRTSEPPALTPSPPKALLEAPPPPAVPPPASTRVERPTTLSSSSSAPASTTDPGKADLPRPDSVTIATRDILAAAAAASAPPSRPAARLSDVSTSQQGTILLRSTDARRYVASAIARRWSGALCFEQERTVRRIVLREGDLVTAASGADAESLVSFLGARGELPRDEVERLAGKIPPYGRHAGAALVAHGWVGQDRLWSVLRAHAEWIATLAMTQTSGTAQLETEPPGRLRSEPSVFGASTGPEIFVELVRRAVSPEEAVVALGGEGGRIGDGPQAPLLAECALPPAESELVARARGGTVGELLGRAADTDIASVLHALALLGVLDVVPAIEGAAPVAPSHADAEAAALEEEAARARVRARLELVEEGDYFAVLGVPRDATSYEIRRAFVELRRAFEPSRILTPRLADLGEDVRKIVLVLEEAYEILRDAGRRERYRRAIDARPS